MVQFVNKKYLLLIFGMRGNRRLLERHRIKRVAGWETGKHLEILHDSRVFSNKRRLLLRCQDHILLLWHRQPFRANKIEKTAVIELYRIIEVGKRRKNLTCRAPQERNDFRKRWDFVQAKGRCNSKSLFFSSAFLFLVHQFLPDHWHRLCWDNAREPCRRIHCRRHIQRTQ